MSDKEIRIGALYPLTGENAAIGQSIREALDFYINLVNHPEVVHVPSALQVPHLHGHKIKLIWADTAGDPLIGVSEVKRLVEKEGCTSIIGSYNSAVTEAASLQTEVLEIPYLTPDTDAEMITKRGLKWLFRTGPTDVMYTKPYFEMMKAMGFTHSTVGSLAENSFLGQDEAAAVINLSRFYKHEMTVLELYDPALPISREKLLSIRHANPNFLFTLQFEEAIIETLNFFKEINYYPMAIFHQTGTYTFEDVLEALGKAADYVFSATVWVIGLTKKLPLAGKVNSMFKAVYGNNFTSVNSRSFTGIYTLVDAIARAGSADPRALREALEETEISPNRLIVPWKGIRFDETGQNALADSMIVQIFNDIPRIVWPKGLAETNPLIPAPPWCER